MVKNTSLQCRLFYEMTLYAVTYLLGLILFRRTIIKITNTPVYFSFMY